jgi:hypothetical protein
MAAPDWPADPVNGGLYAEVEARQAAKEEAPVLWYADTRPTAPLASRLSTPRFFRLNAADQGL